MNLSYEDLMRQAGWTAESYLNAALRAVAKARAAGDIAESDTGAVIAAFIAAAASDYAIGASMKFAEENPGLFIRP